MLLMPLVPHTNHMINQHPITPPTELVSMWRDLLASRSEEDVLIFATQWGADQELEACCGQLHRWGVQGIDRFRAARRPKPLSEADQALEALDRIDQLPTAEDQRIIRRALERLKEMEGQGND